MMLTAVSDLCSDLLQILKSPLSFSSASCHESTSRMLYLNVPQIESPKPNFHPVGEHRCVGYWALLSFAGTLTVLHRWNFVLQGFWSPLGVKATSFSAEGRKVRLEAVCIPEPLCAFICFWGVLNSHEHSVQENMPNTGGRMRLLCVVSLCRDKEL